VSRSPEGLVLDPEARYADVVFVAPEFGDLSKRLAALLSNDGSDSVSTWFYSESTFEKARFVPITRLLRGLCQLLPLRRQSRALVENTICALRFDRKRFDSEIVSSLSNLRCRHLILVKPMLLSDAAAQQIVERSGASDLTVILWDALWRTPTVEPHLLRASRVFTTEQEDVSGIKNGFYLGLPESDCSTSEEGDNAYNVNAAIGDFPTFFTCGSWSVDRFVAAVRLRCSVRKIGGKPNFHLVTQNWFAIAAGRALGFHSRELDPAEYRRQISVCDVLVDLGRVGQSSPSDRLNDARTLRRTLLSTNRTLTAIGDPVVTTKDGFDAAVRRCVEIARSGETGPLWSENEKNGSCIPSGVTWAETVLSPPSQKRDVSQGLASVRRRFAS
jgi:hypothetical protein